MIYPQDLNGEPPRSWTDSVYILSGRVIDGFSFIQPRKSSYCNHIEHNKDKSRRTVHKMDDSKIWAGSDKLCWINEWAEIPVERLKRLVPACSMPRRHWTAIMRVRRGDTWHWISDAWNNIINRPHAINQHEWPQFQWTPIEESEHFDLCYCRNDNFSIFERFYLLHMFYVAHFKRTFVLLKFL